MFLFSGMRKTCLHSFHLEEVLNKQNDVKERSIWTASAREQGDPTVAAVMLVAGVRGLSESLLTELETFQTFSKTPSAAPTVDTPPRCFDFTTNVSAPASPHARLQTPNAL
ncbi:hypothetical protein L798_15432 [Zootermopsis nevadensis]|uniref:Uncharacterized protein n=1 Tax=Zootermopsis nevadensis TaxID=136037 RepID=A0A067QMI7_ZOONE|nr:hypothetical protein L798_15432 [Zootermopsis nevadensis]